MYIIDAFCQFPCISLLSADLAMYCMIAPFKSKALKHRENLNFKRRNVWETHFNLELDQRRCELIISTYILFRDALQRRPPSTVTILFTWIIYCCNTLMT